MSDTLNKDFDSSESIIQTNEFWVNTLRALQTPSWPTQQFWVDYTKTWKISDSPTWFWVKIEAANQIDQNNQETIDHFFQQQQNLVSWTENILANAWISTPDFSNPKLTNKISTPNYMKDLVDFSGRILENRTYKPIQSSFEGIKLKTDKDYQDYQKLQDYYKENSKYYGIINKYNSDLEQRKNSPEPRWPQPQKPDISEPKLDPSLEDMHKKTIEFYSNSTDLLENIFWNESTRQKTAQELKDGKLTLQDIRWKFVDKIKEWKTFEEKLVIANQILIALNGYYDKSYYTQITKDWKSFLQADVLTKTVDPKQMWETVLSSPDKSAKVWVCRDYHTELADILRQAWLESYSASVDATQPHTITMVKNEWKVYLLDRSSTQSFNSFSDAFSFYEQKEALISSEWHFVIGENWKPIQIIRTENWEALNEIVTQDFFSQMEGEIETNWISTTYSAKFDKNNKLVSVDFNHWKWHFDVDSIMKQVNWTNFLAWKIWTQYSINDTLAVFAQLAVWQMTPDEKKVAIGSEVIQSSKSVDFAWASFGFRWKWNWKTYETDSWTTKINASAMARADISAMSNIRENGMKDETKFAWAVSLKAWGEVQALYDSKDWKLHMDSKLWYMTEIFPAQWWRTAFLDWVITNHNIVASSNISYSINQNTQVSGFGNIDYNTLRTSNYVAGMWFQRNLGNWLGLESQASVWVATSKLDGNSKYSNLQGWLNYQLNPQTNIGWWIWLDANWSNWTRTLDPYWYAKVKHIFETGQTMILNAKASKTWGSIWWTFTIPTR